MSATTDLSKLNSKIGLMLMTGIPGPDLDEGTEALIRDCHVGGFILFSKKSKIRAHSGQPVS